MVLKAILVAIAAMALPITNSARAEITDHSANYYLPGCWDFAKKRFGNNPFLQGECVGILEGLSVTASQLDPTFVASRSCAPDDVTLAQMASVVVHWFDQHPERWNEDFRALTLLAMHDAWPCPTKK
jgi:Rap1a immunity proteins